jgi:hypothetical protein
MAKVLAKVNATSQAYVVPPSTPMIIQRNLSITV